MCRAGERRPLLPRGLLLAGCLVHVRRRHLTAAFDSLRRCAHFEALAAARARVRVACAQIAHAAAATAAAPSLAATAACALWARQLEWRRRRRLPPPVNPPPPPPAPLPPLYTHNHALATALTQAGAPPPLPSDGARRAVAMANQTAMQTASYSPATTVRLPPPPPALPPPFPPANPTTLLVAPCDTITAAITLHHHCAPTTPIAILNFAHPSHPGGGYLNGRLAQEEDLCRAIPALFPALSASSYPLDPAATPPTLRTEIWRGPPYSSTLPAAIPVMVITAAAPNLHRSPQLPPPTTLRGTAYHTDFRQRMHRVLHAASEARCRVLVLGAWGCGVFRNDPRVVARLWCEVLDSSWRGHFDVIVFAVVPGPSGRTLRALERTLAPLIA